MTNPFSQPKRRNLSDVDIDRTEGTLYLIQEFEQTGGVRTVAIFVDKQSAERALTMIGKNRKISKKKFFEIEKFNYIEHKNSLVGR